MLRNSRQHLGADFFVVGEGPDVHATRRMRELQMGALPLLVRVFRWSLPADFRQRLQDVFASTASPSAHA